MFNEWEACGCCESSSYSLEICSRILDFGKKLCAPSAWTREFDYACLLPGSSARVKGRRNLGQAQMCAMWSRAPGTLQASEVCPVAMESACVVWEGGSV